MTIEQRDELMLPVTVGLTFADGTSEQRRIPAEAFFTQDAHTLTLTGRLQEVQLDPNQLLPDVNPNNNTWTAPDETGTEDGSSSNQP